jgi:hypothetical protein
MSLDWKSSGMLYYGGRVYVLRTCGDKCEQERNRFYSILTYNRHNNEPMKGLSYLYSINTNYN